MENEKFDLDQTFHDLDLNLLPLSFEASLPERNTGSWHNIILLDGAHLTGAGANLWRWAKILFFWRTRLL